MSDPARPPVDLENDLRRLSADIDYPPEPDLSRSVVGRIEARRPRVWDRWVVGVPRAAAFGVAVLALIAVFGGVLAFSPGARRAVADWLGTGGITIFSDDEGDSTLPPVADDLALGRPVSLQEGLHAVSFEPRLPDDDLVGDPDEVYVSSFPSGGRFSAVYRAGPDLPRTRATGVGLLLMEFRSQVEEVYAKKLVDQGVTVQFVEVVEGEPAYWVRGEHAFLYRDETGVIRQDSARLAGNSLFWEHDGIVYRLESALPLTRVLEIARSIPV